MTPLTVVVPTRDRPVHLAGALAALRHELAPGDEVLVVDSASRRPVSVTGTERVLRTELPGASRARNLGWRAAQTTVVAFVDDDVRVAPGWRRALDAALTGVDGVCGRVCVPPGEEGTERPVAVTPDAPEHVMTTPIGVSANCAVRRAALEAVGGFHERLGPGTWFAAAEDVELFARLLDAGHHLRYAPTVLAHHEQWRGRRALLRLDWRYGKGAGAQVIVTGRTDRPRARRLAKAALWQNGLAPALTDVRNGYEFGVATSLVRTAGTVAGLGGAVVRKDRP